jgi:ribosome-binding factor A
MPFDTVAESFYSRKRSCSHLFVTGIGAESRDPQLAQQLQRIATHLHKFISAEAHLNRIPEQHMTTPL